MAQIDGIKDPGRRIVRGVSDFTVRFYAAEKTVKPLRQDVAGKTERNFPRVTLRSNRRSPGS